MARKARQAAKRPSMAKAKKMVTKAHKAKAKKNMDTFFLKAKTTVTVSPAQGALTSNFIYRAFSLDPTGSGDYAQNGTALYLNNAEFQLYRLQFDKFRVNSVKITVVPKANVLDQANAQNDGVYNVTGDGLVHTCIDRDSIAPSSKAVVSRYPSYRKYSILKPFSRSYSVKYPTGIWIDCQSPATFHMAQELGLRGTVTMYAENVLEDRLEVINEPWATVTVEYNIVFQGKSSNNLTGVYDENGNLTGVTINAIDESINLPFSPATMVTGTLDADIVTTYTDASGNKPYVDVKINDMGGAL